MQTWTEQMGLPVVEVVKDGNNYRLKQKRFLANQDDYNVEVEPSSFKYVIIAGSYAQYTQVFSICFIAIAGPYQ